MHSTRGYLPKAVSHHTASWVPPAEFESTRPPAWPFVDDAGVTWDRDELRRRCIDPYLAALGPGAPVHVGEWGCFHHTPHRVALAWMDDLVSLWHEVGWGWAMWNLRGEFGIVDSARPDADYEPYRGRLLDRAMLELLRRH